jgi:hypothetical protein
MIAEAALKLMTFEGFNDKVNELTRHYITRKDAYEAAEREYAYYFGVNRFTCYQSFRSTQYYFKQKSNLNLAKQNKVYFFIKQLYINISNLNCI